MNEIRTQKDAVLGFKDEKELKRYLRFRKQVVAPVKTGVAA